MLCINYLWAKEYGFDYLQIKIGKNSGFNLKKNNYNFGFLKISLILNIIIIVGSIKDIPRFL